MNDRSDFGARFKSAVERNFDQSAGLYEQFETRHRLFEEITRRLCDASGIVSPGRVLDVGCGTGISTLAILQAIPAVKEIRGIDISEAMLDRARARLAPAKGVAFIKGDAERLPEYYQEPFDAIFYTASVFLIPDFRKSISQACTLLNVGGALLISFYEGFFDGDGKDAFARVFPDMNYRYGAVRFEDLFSCLNAEKRLKTQCVDYRFEVDGAFVQDFLTIPAQSAGLFPKVAYPDRIPLVTEFVGKLVEAVHPLFMGWKFLIAKKS